MVVLGVAFGSGFGPVSAMESGLWGLGTGPKSPVARPGKPAFAGPQSRFSNGISVKKQKTNQQSRREIELFEKRNRAFRGGFRGGFRMISLFTVAFGARDCWFKALRDCCSGIHSRWLLPPQTEECHPRVSMKCTVRVFPRKPHADPCRESGKIISTATTQCRSRRRSARSSMQFSQKDPYDKGH